MKEETTTPTTAVAQMGDFNALSMYFNSEQFATAQRVCQMLACSDLVPKEYQYKPINILNPDGTVNPTLKAQDDNNRSRAVANCMIALNKAATLRSDPLTIMQNMGIVYGRPSWSSSFLIGTVNSCGRYTPLKYQFGEDGRVKETYKVYKRDGGGIQKSIDVVNMTCYAYATEKATNQELKGSTISIRMAFDENWIQKDGSKWITMPDQMLMYRAAAFWSRTYAPDVAQGMYTREESEDIYEAEVISSTIKPERQRIQLPAPEYEEASERPVDNDDVARAKEAAAHAQEASEATAERAKKIEEKANNQQPAAETKTDNGIPY